MYFLKKNRYKLVAKVLLFVFVIEPVFLFALLKPVSAQTTNPNNFNQAFGGYDGISQWGDLDIINNPAISSALKSCLQVVPSFSTKIQKVFGGKSAQNSSAILNSGRSNILKNFCRSDSTSKWYEGLPNGYGNKIEGFMTDAEKLACGGNSDKISGLADILDDFATGGGDVQQTEDKAAIKKLDSIKKDQDKVLEAVEASKKEVEKTNKTLDETKIREECMDSISYSMSKTLLAGVTEGTVNLINTGNFGDSFFIKDSKTYFEDLDKTTLKQVFSGLLDQDSKDSSTYPFLKSTYKNLVSQNVDTEFKESSKFTLGNFLSKKNGGSSDGAESVKAFKNDFSVGGWDGWLALTQQSQNNPIGFAILAQEQVSRSQSAAKEQVKTELAGGLLSMKKCTQQEVPPTYNEKTGQMEGGGTITRGIEVGPNDTTCTKSEVVTPGSVLSSRLDAVITSDVRQLEMADKFNESLNLIFTSAFNTLNTAGLSGLSSKTYGSWASKINDVSFIERYNGAVGGGAKEQFNAALDSTKEKYFSTIDSTIDMYNNTVNGSVVKYNNTIDGTIDTFDTVKGIIEKYNVTDGSTKTYTSKITTTTDVTGNTVNNRTWYNNTGIVVSDGKKGFSTGSLGNKGGAELIYHRSESSYASYDFDITKDLFDQQIGCTTRPGIVSLEKNYLKELERGSNPANSALYKLMPAMAELDFCIPGPTTNWEEIADENYAEVVTYIAENGIGIPLDTSVDGTFYSAVGKRIGQMTDALEKRNLARTSMQAVNLAFGAAFSAVTYGITAAVAGIANAVIEYQKRKDTRKTEATIAALEDASGTVNGAITTAVEREGREWTELQLGYLKEDYIDYKEAVYDKFSDKNSLPFVPEARAFVKDLPALADNLFTIQQDYAEEIKTEKQVVEELVAIATRVGEINAAATKLAKDKGLPTDVPKECKPAANQCPSSGIMKNGKYTITTDPRAYNLKNDFNQAVDVSKLLIGYSGPGSNAYGTSNVNQNQSANLNQFAAYLGYYPYTKPTVHIIFNAEKKFRTSGSYYEPTLQIYTDETNLSVVMSSTLSNLVTGEIYGLYSAPVYLRSNKPYSDSDLNGKTITVTAYNPNYLISGKDPSTFTSLTCTIQPMKVNGVPNNDHLICDK